MVFEAQGCADRRERFAKSFIKFSDLNRLPLDVVEQIVRDSVAGAGSASLRGAVPTQAELLKLWDVNEEAAAPAGKNRQARDRQACGGVDRRN